MGAFSGAFAGGASVQIVINGVDRFSNVLNKATSKLGKFGGIASAAIGGATAILTGTAVATTALGIASLKTALSFEDAFTGVKKTVDLTAEGFADLEQRFKDISTTTPITFQELSGIGELAGQLGVSGVDNITKFTKTIADISVTTNMTADAAATDFARIANVMQEPIENVDKMGATIVDLGNNLATTESEISSFAQRIAGGGKIAGLTTADIMAIGAAMSSVGIEAEAGGTAVQKILMNMTKATTEGGKKLRLFAGAAGMSGKEFQQLFKDDPSKVFEQFVKGLGKAGDDAFGILEDLGMQDQRLMRSFLSLANAGDLITDSLNISDKAWQENTALTEEAEKRYATASSMIQILKNTFTNLFQELIVNTGVFDKFKKGIQLITEFVTANKDKIIGFFEKVGEFLTPIVQQTIEWGKKGLQFIIDVWPKLVEGFNKLMTFLQPVVDAARELFDNIFTGGQEIVERLFEVFKNNEGKFNNIMKMFRDHLVNVFKFFGDIFNAAKDLFNFLVDVGVIDTVISLFELWATVANKVFKIIKDIFNTVVDLIKKLAESDFGQFIISGISKAQDFGQFAMGGITNFLKGNEENVNDFILSKGKLIKTHPQDTIMGSKSGGMGSNITVSIENVYGTDPDEIADALQFKLNNMVTP